MAWSASVVVWYGELWGLCVVCIFIGWVGFVCVGVGTGKRDRWTYTTGLSTTITHAGFCSVMVARMMGMLMHCTKVDVTSAGRAL